MGLSDLIAGGMDATAGTFFQTGDTKRGIRKSGKGAGAAWT